MENYIVFVIVGVVLAVAVLYTVKHFRHEGGCCGSGGYKPRKKKLPRVIARKTFTVSGMHCVNCKNRVEEIVGDISGIAGVVDLKSGELVVLYAEQVEDDVIISRVGRAGYTVERKMET